MQKLVLKPSVAGTLTLKQFSRVHQNTPFSFPHPPSSAPQPLDPLSKIVNTPLPFRNHKHIGVPDISYERPRSTVR